MRSLTYFVIPALLFTLGFQLQAQVSLNPQFPAGSSNLPYGLDDTQLASGLKEALLVGTQKAVKKVAKPGGYLENKAIKIPLPPSLVSFETSLRAAGEGPKIDDLVASINHAAEAAAPDAANLFSDLIKDMTISDPGRLLTGGNTSITDYFRSKTWEELLIVFRPEAEDAMKANGVTQKYDTLVDKASTLSGVSLSLGNSSRLDIDAYVVNETLKGMFYMLGKQEQEIRANPGARSTDLLRKVFGHTST